MTYYEFLIALDDIGDKTIELADWEDQSNDHIVGKNKDILIQMLTQLHVALTVGTPKSMIKEW